MGQYVSQLWYILIDYKITLKLHVVGTGLVCLRYRDKWEAVVNMVLNLGVPWNARNFLTSWETISFTTRTLPMELVHNDDCSLILNNNMKMWNTVICPFFILQSYDANFMPQFCTIMKCTTVKIHFSIKIMCRIWKPEIKINLNTYTTKNNTNLK
jgi:hypothetical protein